MEQIPKVIKAVNKDRVFWFMHIDDWTAEPVTEEELFKLALAKNVKVTGQWHPCPNYEDDWYAYRRRNKI